MIEQAKGHCKNHEVIVIMGHMNAKVGGDYKKTRQCVGSIWVRRKE